MEKVTRLFFSKVESESGEYLGRLVDFRSDGAPDHGILNESRVVTGIVVVRKGLIGSRKIVIPWSNIKKFTRNHVVVKDNPE